MCLFQLWMVQKVSRQWRKLCTWRQKRPFLAVQQFSSLTSMSGGKNSSTWWWALSHYNLHYFTHKLTIIPALKAMIKCSDVTSLSRKISHRISSSPSKWHLNPYAITLGESTCWHADKYIYTSMSELNQPRFSFSYAVIRIQVAFCCFRRREHLQTFRLPL